MTHDTSRLATMIGSRICHDLISPLGAVNNGLELMQLSDMPQTAEMSLISQSVNYANARIRFFRLAFGMASDGQMTGAEEINAILQDLQIDGRLRIGAFPQGTHARGLVRVILLAMLCVEQAIPYGGELVVETQGATWQVRARAERLKVDSEAWGLLTDADPHFSLTPAAVQFAILPELLLSVGLTCQTAFSDTCAEIRLMPASHHPR